MATKHNRKHDHERLLSEIDLKISSQNWEERSLVFDMIDMILSDFPDDNTTGRLFEFLKILAHDEKWESRKAAAMLGNIYLPETKSILALMTKDENRWVRQAAERTSRKLSRLTTPAEKIDKRLQFAFDVIKGFEIKTPEKVYEAAILIGEKYYEELAADTAHELNTYRASMEALLGDLEHVILSKNKDTNQDAKEIFEKIKERSSYLKTLVAELIEYSKDTEIAFAKHRMDTIIRDSVKLARQRIRGPFEDVNYKEVVSISVNIEAEVCKTRLVRALSNIIGNAVESFLQCNTEGLVNIALEEKDSERFLIIVQDNGCGIDSSQIENAKKRFRSLKKGQGGIGLGLPYCIKVIEREHNGKLEIDSELGKGTTVKIELPINQQREI